MSPAKRGSLTGMLPAPVTAPPMPVRPAAPSPAEIQTPEVQTPKAASSQPSRRQARQSAAPTLHVPTESPSLPKYLRLERKELLMWPGQITKLSILARVLNKNRGGAGERITVNTLIRVATALLLSRSQELEGTTEEELRRSLGLAELQASDLQSRPDQVASSRLRWFVSHGRHLGAPTADQVIALYLACLGCSGAGSRSAGFVPHGGHSPSVCLPWETFEGEQR